MDQACAGGPGDGAAGGAAGGIRTAAIGGPAAAVRGGARTPWWAWVAPLGPAAVALAVGVYQIARPSLWRDEAYTIEAASRSPAQILAMLRHVDAVHGAYYLCMHVIITLFGRSETAVRLPSVAATAVAAGLVVALGSRLAARQGASNPYLIGLVAGFLYAVGPQVTRYAQEARSYAAVTALATGATYLFVRGLDDGRRRWWVGYAVLVALTALFNLFGLLIVVPHAVTLLAARGRLAGQGRACVRRWAVAVAAAAVVAAPVVVFAYRQRAATSWLTRPGLGQIRALVTAMAGSALLAVVIGVLIVAAGWAWLATGGRLPVSIVTVALPWLVLPSAVLIAVSQAHPVYDFRYVVFCLPAVALLAADGLGVLARQTARLLGTQGRAALAWLPALAVLAVILVAVIPPQHAIRLPGSRADNLRKVSAIIAANARPGDAVLYIHMNSRAISEGYPGPFRRLWDIALERGPVASDNLLGIEVSPAVLSRRFAALTRVWVISESGAALPAPAGRADAEKLSLISGLRLVGRWHTANDLLLLYARP